MFKKYLSKRMLLIFLLGFSSGLPLSIISGLFSAWFKTSGLSIVSIGFLGLIAQPYAYKFLWAPLLDRFEPPFFKWLDHRRAWILILR
jgi:MFS transporter, PAT family, beta-lactamase induction signal transducer AmpG